MKFNNKLISNNYPTDYVLEAIKYAFEKKQLKRKLVGQIITNTIKYLNCIVNDNVKELQIIITYITNLLNYDNIEDNNIRNNTVLDPVSQDIILKESIRVSIIIAIWIKIPLKSYLRKLIFLSGGVAGKLNHSLILW